MDTLKASSAAAFVFAAIATPAFAQEFYGPYVAAPYGAVGPAPTYYRSYGQVPGDYLPPRNTEEYWNLVNHGFTGRDPSRVGGESPNLNPPGN
jgi:hypothetical protein